MAGRSKPAGKGKQEKMQDPNNPFDQADAWEVSLGDYIPEGNHVATAMSVEGASSNNGNPKIIIEWEDTQGRTMRDFVPYSSSFLSKVVALYDAAGLDRPAPGEFDPNDEYRLTDSKIAELKGKKVGLVVRPETNENTGKTYNRAAGYVQASEISDLGGNSVTSARQNTEDDDDIPF